jgi:hypothetical protein
VLCSSLERVNTIGFECNVDEVAVGLCGHNGTSV